MCMISQPFLLKNPDADSQRRCILKLKSIAPNRCDFLFGDASTVMSGLKGVRLQERIELLQRVVMLLPRESWPVRVIAGPTNSNPRF